MYRQHGIEPDATAPAGVDTQDLSRRPKAENAVVWTLQGHNNLTPVQVQLGITDHAYTQVSGVLKGTLNEGDKVVIRTVLQQSQTPGGLPR